MELANQWTGDGDLISRVRVARRSDAADIRKLLQTAEYRHLHIDWYVPGDWLGSPGFVVLPNPVKNSGSVAAKMLGQTDSLVACLAAAADPLPAAWVRVAAINSPDQSDAPSMLAALLKSVIPFLRQQQVTQLAWLTADEWPNFWLKKLGFQQVNQIETYIKEDRDLPLVKPVPGLRIRPVIDSDLDRLAQIEENALDPLWRHSSQALIIARPQSLSFDVAVWREKIAAFQLSVRSEQGAHLVRLTVDPQYQRTGIGSALLAHALSGYYQQNLHTVTLNTQADNEASHVLYRKFGFQSGGYRLPVWSLDLAGRYGTSAPLLEKLS